MIVRDGYIIRRCAGSVHGKCRPEVVKYRNWWIVKATKRNIGSIKLPTQSLTFPPQYVGKRIRLKVELFVTPLEKKNGKKMK
jgi:hypothetical protein